jgi:hypothetical protein
MKTKSFEFVIRPSSVVGRALRARRAAGSGVPALPLCHHPKLTAYPRHNTYEYSHYRN